MNLLPDTNALTALFKGEKAVMDALASARLVNLSLIVVGEMTVGFKGGKRERYNRELFEEFLNMPTCRVLGITRETAENYAAIWNTLKKAGTPIPSNDIWIAAQAMETGSAVLSYDVHFRRIANLRVLSP